MIAIASARPGLFARLALAVLAATGIASCGSGAVGQPPVSDSARITILPSTATLYSGLPTTFQISGGTGAYIVSSSNQAIVPVSGTNQTGVLTIVPNNVTADTPVTITVRDTGTAPLATATLTVRPNAVSNDISVTPSANQGGSCAPAVCSGGDAVVSATISQGGIPLAARGVRFSVVSGNYRFITSPPDQPETLATSIDVISDELGHARARIRVFVDSENQTALLQVMDLGTLAFQRVTFLIAQSTGTSPGFVVTPSSVTFAGSREDRCAGSVANEAIPSATFFVFGGVPPYQVLSSATTAFEVTLNDVSRSPGSFEVRPTGQCVAEPGLPIIVRDSAGRSSTVTVANIPGTASVPPLSVAPSQVTLGSCTASATVSVAGGTGRYFRGSGSDLLFVTIAGNVVTIKRAPNTPAVTDPTDVSVGITDGNSSQDVTVHLVGAGAAACP